MFHASNVNGSWSITSAMCTAVAATYATNITRNTREATPSGITTIRTGPSGPRDAVPVVTNYRSSVMKRLALLAALAMSGSVAYAQPARPYDRPADRYDHDRDRDRVDWNHDRYDRYGDSHWSRDVRRWVPL